MAFQVVWIEIPVKDIERAAKFYEAVFEVKYQINDDGVRRTATIADSSQGVGVSLNQTANFEPSDKGVFLYVDTGKDLNDWLPRIEPAGGTVMTEKIFMPGAGHYAAFKDTEGNLLALYSVD